MSSLLAKGIPDLPSLQGLNAPVFPLWLMRIITIFPLSGFVGADHFLVGSNLSGAAKAIFNIITLGAWYFYDVCYISSSVDVTKKGFELPFFGGGNFGLGRVEETLRGPMNNLVSLIMTAIVAVILGCLTYLMFFLSGITTGIPNSVSTSLMWVTGVVTVILILKTALGLYSAVKGVVSGPVPTPAIPAIPAALGPGIFGVQQGGGEDPITMVSISQKIIEQQGAGQEYNESALFLGILGVVALGGIAYAVYKYKKESKPKEDETSSDTEGV